MGGIRSVWLSIILPRGRREREYGATPGGKMKSISVPYKMHSTHTHTHKVLVVGLFCHIRLVIRMCLPLLPWHSAVVALEEWFLFAFTLVLPGNK